MALLLFVSSLSIGVEYSEHFATPHTTPAITTIHVVSSNHFDGGCKIRGCNTASSPDWVDPMWHANGTACAMTMHGPGQPHAYHVVNRAFSNWFPLAAKLGDAARAASPPKEFKWMTQSWLVALYLDCEGSNYVAWDGSGKNLLQCPNSTAVATFKRAVKMGDIFWHAATTDHEAGAFPSASLFNASLEIGHRLAIELGVKPPTAVSQRDVPGWTRAAIPLLVKHGINGISFGSGTPPGKPDGVPPLYLWRDVASGTEVVVTSESGYGGTGTLFVLTDGTALAAAWTGDNSGPTNVEGSLEKLRATYPSATVISSTFDAFFDVANIASNKAGLPVVTSEVGDAWIYGVPSDPLKMARLRAVTRVRDDCIARGECDITSPAMRAFDRLLVKVPEHTWGLAQSWFTADYANYTNVQFRAALTACTAPVANSAPTLPVNLATS